MKKKSHNSLMFRKIFFFSAFGIKKRNEKENWHKTIRKQLEDGIKP